MAVANDGRHTPLWSSTTAEAAQTVACAPTWHNENTIWKFFFSGLHIYCLKTGVLAKISGLLGIMLSLYNLSTIDWTMVDTIPKLDQSNSPFQESVSGTEICWFHSGVEHLLE